MPEFPERELKIIPLDKFNMVVFKEELADCPFYEFVGDPLRNIVSPSAPISHRTNKNKYFYDVTNANPVFLRFNKNFVKEINVRVVNVEKPKIKPKSAKQVVSLIDVTSEKYNALSLEQKREIGWNYCSLVDLGANQFGLISIVSIKGNNTPDTLYLTIPSDLSEQTYELIQEDIAHFVQLHNNILTPEDYLIKQDIKSSKGFVMKPVK